MMNIDKFLDKIKLRNIIKNNSGEFNHIQFDSRLVLDNTLFIAVVGTQLDGHKYINAAIDKGASVIICEEMPIDIKDTVTYIQVEDSSFALGIVASEFFNKPSSKLKLIGITGTNGKTTIATSLYNLFKNLGFRCGLISTIQVKIDNLTIESTHTTPDPIQINQFLDEMVSAGCDYCFMEVSSHAIVQNRIAGLEFIAGVFTNITHDHLDYHKTFNDYIKAKQKFFDYLPSNAFALVNADDRNARIIIQNSEAKIYTYSLRSVTDFKVKLLESHFDGMLLNIDDYDVWTSFIGKFNAYNILAVYAVAVLCGFDKTEVLTHISKLEPVEGRFDSLRSANGITAIVDYAHTPDALKNVLETINEILQAGGDVISVVGCGGDRDKSKRPEMADIVAKNSTKIILTSDNPRSEDPEKILDDMQKGISVADKRKVLRILNREEAIKTAAMLAKNNDVILIAGKGHEKYQEINGVKHPFDDKELIIKIFKELL